MTRVGALSPVAFAARWSLLVAGLLAWAAWSDLAPFSVAHWSLLGVAAVVVAVPDARRRAWTYLRRLRRPTPTARARIACAIAVLAAVFFWTVAAHAGRRLGLAWHDEHSYAIQVRQLVEGRFWGPPHPLADFFDSHYIITQPVYASMYFPGTAMLHVLGALLGFPFWLTALVISGAAAGLIYRVVAELIDGVAGLLAALLFSSIVQVQHMAVMLMSQIPVVMLSCLLVWAWLRWRGSGRAGWALLMGVFAGWLVVTRPVDGACIVGGLLLGLLPDLWACRRTVAGNTIIAGFAGVAPFLIVQASINRGITGSVASSPHDFFVARDLPKAQFGFHELTPLDHPQSVVQQNQAFFRAWAAPRIQRHDPSRIWEEWQTYRARFTIAAWTPHALAITLLPLGLLGLNRRRAAVAIALPPFLALYSFYCFYIASYPVAVLLPSVVVLVLGVREVPLLVPRWRRGAAVFAPLGTVAVAVGSWPLVNDRSVSRDTEFSEFRAIDQMIAELPQKPAAVLFRWSEQLSLHVEPVYNTDVAWPDDAEIVRAHDLGPRNSKLVEYYAKRQPQRHLYIYDRAQQTRTHLGTVAEVWSRLEGERATKGRPERRSP